MVFNIRTISQLVLEWIKDNIMEKKIKHLEMIENIILRMSNNSFWLKGWAVSLIVAIFILADVETNQIYSMFTFIPVVSFWFLDAYYLLIERKYAILYNVVLQKNEEEVDFDLSISNINYMKIKDKKLKYRACLFSITEGIFYIPIFIVLIIVYKATVI